MFGSIDRRRRRNDWRNEAMCILDPRDAEMADQMSSDSDGKPPAFVEDMLAEARELKKTRDAQKPLRDAAQEGDAKRVRALLAQGADVNCDDLDGLTAAHYAVMGGHQEVVAALCEHGGSMLAISRFGGRPVEHALQDKKLECLAAMPVHALNYTEYGLTTAHRMAIADTADVLSLLAMKGPSLLNEVCDKVGWSPAHYAADKGCVAALSVLVTAKVDLTIKDPLGLTPLEIARNRLAEIERRDKSDYKFQEQVRRCCEMLSLGASCQARVNSKQEEEIAVLRQRMAELEAGLSDKESSWKKGSSRGKRGGRKVKAQLLRRNQDREDQSGSGEELNDTGDASASGAVSGLGAQTLDDPRVDDYDGHSSIPNTASDLYSCLS